MCLCAIIINSLYLPVDPITDRFFHIGKPCVSDDHDYNDVVLRVRMNRRLVVDFFFCFSTPIKYCDQHTCCCLKAPTVYYNNITNYLVDPCNDRRGRAMVPTAYLAHTT